MATGKFVLDKGRTGKFRFNLLSTNGRVVATSESYDTKAAALKGVAAVQKLAAGARLVDNTVAAAPTKKATAKKVTAKKAVAKKTVAKKAAARKPAARKAAPRKAAASRAKKA